VWRLLSKNAVNRGFLRPSDKKAVIIFFVIKKRAGGMDIKYLSMVGVKEGARISLSRGSVLSRVSKRVYTFPLVQPFFLGLPLVRDQSVSPYSIQINSLSADIRDNVAKIC